MYANGALKINSLIKKRGFSINRSKLLCNYFALFF